LQPREDGGLCPALFRFLRPQAQAAWASCFHLAKARASALSQDADILIYGCDVVASANGKSLIGALVRLTGADAAASDIRVALAIPTASTLSALSEDTGKVLALPMVAGSAADDAAQPALTNAIAHAPRN